MWRQKIVLCFFICLSVNLVRDTQGLSFTDEGVCSVKMSTRHSKAVTYLVTLNKFCGRKKCVVQRTKTVPYTQLETHAVCCYGWTYNSDHDTCVPICRSGCPSGRCVSPDTCQCDPPAILHQPTNTCVTCQNCVNADCIADNQCHCKTNYTAFNATHCFQCEEGYGINYDFTCKPKCDEECVNGQCTAPNTCSCADGYIKKDDKDKCEKICDLSCVNSKCIDSTCMCLDGYNKVNETHCDAECSDCENGSCVSPQNCLCNSGFEKIGGKCEPICEQSCVNGKCISPNVCSCNEGYVMNGTDHICEKQSMCDAQCSGGICEPKKV